MKLRKINGVPIFHWVAISLAIILSGCEKIDIDTQVPKIILIQPDNNSSFTVGNDFLVVTVMHDYVELATYRYKVFWYDDPSNVSDNPADPAFELDMSDTIEVNDADPQWEDVNFSIDIPVGIRHGYYNLDIYCYDKAGNFDKVSLRLLFHD